VRGELAACVDDRAEVPRVLVGDLGGRVEVFLRRDLDRREEGVRIDPER
jgi:hypothetical protein